MYWSKLCRCNCILIVQFHFNRKRKRDMWCSEACVQCTPPRFMISCTFNDWEFDVAHDMHISKQNRLELNRREKKYSKLIRPWSIWVLPQNNVDIYYIYIMFIRQDSNHTETTFSRAVEGVGVSLTLVKILWKGFFPYKIFSLSKSSLPILSKMRVFLLTFSL